MAERSDVNTAKVALIGSLGAIIVTAVTLTAAVSYYAVADHVERSRSDEAVLRTQRQVEQIAAGKPISQPWLNPDLQRATQEARLAQYARRIITQGDGSERTTYAVPIQHAMQSVLQDAAAGRSEMAMPKEAGT